MLRFFLDIYPQYNVLPPDFKRKVAVAYGQRHRGLIYRRTSFHLHYSADGNIDEMKAVTRGPDPSLPPAFREGGLRIGRVKLLCQVPKRLAAKPDWYRGKDYGLPGAEGCLVDPVGKYEGKPQIYVVGDSFSDVLALFRRVMSGRLNT